MNDGGQAFPRQHENWPGMSLLDWFAGQALAAVDPSDLAWGTVGAPTNPWPRVAKDCYDAAEAMLAESERRRRK